MSARPRQVAVGLYASAAYDASTSLSLPSSHFAYTVVEAIDRCRGARCTKRGVPSSLGQPLVAAMIAAVVAT